MILLLALMILGNGHATAAEPWPAAVRDWRSPAPGEHPRLFFRRNDLPELRRRAETPEGQIIVRRLREMLNGGDGETMPAVFPKAKAAYEGVDRDLPRGAYTLWHGAGYGFLFQLTRDRKYADLAQKCVELALGGMRDRDDRYAFVNPGGFLRAGPSLSAVAMAYDLAYDGWNEVFRQRIALAIQNYDGGGTSRDGGGRQTLERLVLRPRLTPRSNHWGPQVGGAALALLAIRGDPGTDTDRVERLLAVAERNTVRALTEGFGDGGYFYEHAGPGQIASDTALLPALQAWRIAGGKDFMGTRSNAAMITMIRVYELLRRPDGGYHYPLRHPSSYGTRAFERDGLSRGGQLAQGFGVIPDIYKPALLWTYRHVLEPDPLERTYDTVSPYPHRAVLSLVNWPVGVEERNPAEVFPRALFDRTHRYILFRNRWRDADDIVVTALLGARPERDGLEPILVWGLGRQVEFPVLLPKLRVTHFEIWPDGGGTFSAPVRDGVCAVAVGFGDDSVFVVMTAPGLRLQGDAHTRAVSAGDRPWLILTLQRGDPPPLEAEGDAVRIGNRRLNFDGVRIVEENSAGRMKR